MGKRGVRICIIGTEVTNGFINDTNTAFFAKELYSRGLDLIECRTIPDSRDIILNTWREFTSDGNLVINSGGLGPTDDDLTVDLLSEFLGTEPVYDDEASRRVNYYFRKKANTRKKISMELALRQARVPGSTVALKNSVGLAPGIWAPQINLLALPGFPMEIKSIWPHALTVIDSLPLPKKETRIISIWGMGESQLFSQLPRDENIDIGVHALPIGCRLFLRNRIKEDTVELENLTQEISSKFNDLIVEEPLSEFIDFLVTNRLKLATAESCTGGLAAKLATDIPGSSAWFNGSVVTYSNEAKVKLLNVSNESLNKHGAVSAQVAAEMAKGALDACDADISISTTGIAGPDGGSEEKPVGTVFTGIADKREQKVFTAKFFYPFGRERFRSAVVHSLFFSLWLKYVFAKKSDWQATRFGKNFVEQQN